MTPLKRLSRLAIYSLVCSGSAFALAFVLCQYIHTQSLFDALAIGIVVFAAFGLVLSIAALVHVFSHREQLKGSLYAILAILLIPLTFIIMGAAFGGKQRLDRLKTNPPETRAE